MLIASRAQQDADLKKLGADLRAGLQQMIDNILKAETGWVSPWCWAGSRAGICRESFKDVQGNELS